MRLIFDLNAFADQTVIIRFAFGSDPAYSTVDDVQLKGFFIDDIIIKDNLDNSIASYNADDENSNLLNYSGNIWKDLFYDYYSEFCLDEDLTILTQYPAKEICEANNYFWYSRPGSSDWEEYLPGDPVCDNCNYFLDLTEYAGKDVVLRFWARYDNDHSKQGEGLYIDDITVYKESIQIYAQPQLFKAEAADDKVQLTWYDMNESGDSTIIFDSGDSSLFLGIKLEDCSDCLAFAGTLFPSWLGPSTVDLISIYNINESTIDVMLQAYGLINNDPVQSLNITLLESGWNTFDVSWDFSSVFLIAHSFSDQISAAFDPSTSMAGLWVLSNDAGSWIYAGTDEDTVQIAGNWGIRAKVSYEGLNVTYNLYRDGTTIQTGLTAGSFTDSDIEYETEYYYKLGVVYPDGIEIISSDSIAITTPLPPLPDDVSELLYDDDSFESEFNAGSGQYSAVKFALGSDSKYLYMIRWYQVGDGGAFIIKIFNDNNGTPGDEIFSKIQASGNEDGWNEKDLTSEKIEFSDDFWIGTKEFSSSLPFGLDTDSNSGNSYQREGENGEWILIEGNLAIRAYLSSEPLGITSAEIPLRFGIRDIFPNPFNPIVNIHYNISQFGPIEIHIYDLNGRMVTTLVNDYKQPGRYSAFWNGLDQYNQPVSSGIYLAVLKSNQEVPQTRKLIFCFLKLRMCVRVR